MQRIGKYEVLQEIGRGGFGRVFKALDPTIQRIVALKVISIPAGSSSAESQDFLARFRSEASLTARLQHSNIVTIHEFGEHNGIPYLAMEFLEGQDLGASMRAGDSRSLLSKLHLIRQAASALAYAHRQGIVHRDIKPNNIMVLRDESVKVVDFGIAKALGGSVTSITKTGFQVGTLRYMSPEQLSGRPSDRVSDIFSLGIVLYELLANQYPFNAQSEAALIYQIVNEPHREFHSLGYSFPPRLLRLVDRSLAKHPEMRYQSLNDFEVDLRPVIVQLERGEAHRLTQLAQHHLNLGENEEASVLVRQAMELDPANTDAQSLDDQLQEIRQRNTLRQRIRSLIEQASQAEGRREWEAASECLQRALRLDGDDKEARLALQRCLEGARREEQARAQLVQARHRLASKDWSGAQSFLNQALLLSPELPDAAQLLTELTEWKAARQRDEGISRVLSQAHSLMRVSQLSEALSLLQDALKTFGDVPEFERLVEKIRESISAGQRQRELEEGLAAAQKWITVKDWESGSAHLKFLQDRFGSNPTIVSLLSVCDEQIGLKKTDIKVKAIIQKTQGLISKSQWQAALALLKESLASYPSHPDLLNALESVSVEINKIEASEKEAVEIRKREALLKSAREKTLELRPSIARLEIPEKLTRVSDAVDGGIVRRKRWLVLAILFVAISTVLFLFYRGKQAPLTADVAAIQLSAQRPFGIANIRSSGGSSIQFEVFSPASASWLNVDKFSGMTPAEVKLIADPIRAPKTDESVVVEIRSQSAPELKLMVRWKAAAGPSPSIPETVTTVPKSGEEPQVRSTKEPGQIPGTPQSAALKSSPKSEIVDQQPGQVIRSPKPSNITTSGPAASATLPGTPAGNSNLARKIVETSDWYGDESGRITWVGTLRPGETIRIDGRQASSGSLSPARGFEPVAQILSVATAGITLLEAPSATNEWNRAVLRNDSGEPVSRIQLNWKVRR